jgi:hypothetical protein
MSVHFNLSACSMYPFTHNKIGEEYTVLQYTQADEITVLLPLPWQQEESTGAKMNNVDRRAV